MVVLKNIIKNEDIKTIEADYFPGGGEIFGYNQTGKIKK